MGRVTGIVMVIVYPIKFNPQVLEKGQGIDKFEDL